MTVRLRPVLDRLPAYRPGRSPADVARELGLDHAIKLASNEVSYGPLPSVAAVLRDAVGGINRYPDMAATELTTTVAARFGVEPGQVALGPGSVGLAQQMVLATCEPGDEVVYAWRSFEAYPIITAIGGGESVQVPLREHTHDLPAMAAAVTDSTRLMFVCNPNNPTGTASRRAELETLLDAVPDDILIVIDEAYREFVRDDDVPDGLDLARGRDNVVVLRTMSKAYGLAGLRVGYALGPAPIAEALRKVQIPFGVSTLAQIAGIASLRHETELATRLDEVVAERARVRTALLELGADVPETQANFVWLPLGENSMRFARGCEESGVIVRPFAEEGVRVSIGTPEENDRFLAVAAPLLSA